MRRPSIRASGRSRILRATGFERAWIALHGPGGEDGLMQGALEWLGIPYTGSGVLASALTMDKLKTKRVVVGAGLAAPPYAVLASTGRSCRARSSDRPAADGQARLAGLERRHHQGQDARRNCRSAYAEARAVDPIVFAEAFVEGDEFTVGVLRDQRAALDPHRAGDRVLRLPGEVLPRRHAVSLPERPRRARRGRACRPRRSRPSA